MLLNPFGWQSQFCRANIDNNLANKSWCFLTCICHGWLQKLILASKALEAEPGLKVKNWLRVVGAIAGLRGLRVRSWAEFQRLAWEAFGGLTGCVWPHRATLASEVEGDLRGHFTKKFCFMWDAGRNLLRVYPVISLKRVVFSSLTLFPSSLFFGIQGPVCAKTREKILFKYLKQYGFPHFDNFSQ